MYIDEIEVGQSASIERDVTQGGINQFAEVSGDHNPVHVDPAYAASTQFKGVIAHGILSAAYISSVLGNQLPGPGSIYMGQTLKFRAPVRPGDKVVTTCTVKEVNRDKNRVLLVTICKVGDRVVLEGEATMLVQAKPVQG